MSEYFKGLDPISKKRYAEKLRLLDLAESDDPYAERNNDKFEDDMTRWPPVEYGHIFCYFIERPAWPLHTTSVDAVEESRCVQLFSERTREGCTNLVSTTRQCFEGICQSQPKCPRQGPPCLDGYPYRWRDCNCPLHVYGWVST